MLVKKVCLCFSLMVVFLGQTQTTDSLQPKRFYPLTIGTTVAWAGGIASLYHVWYSDYEKTSWHSFDDSREWMQMDKWGHVWTTYHLSKGFSSAYRWSGLERNKAAWVGAGIGWGFQFSLECLDAQSAAWGFSWSDLGANTLGSALYLSQELAWQKQVVQIKFSYVPSPYASIRPETLGNTFAERLLKDYNGQRYWLSVSPHDLGWRQFPEWGAIAFGAGTDAKLHGTNNEYTDPTTGITYHAQREWLLSLDIHVEKLPIRRSWIKKVVSPFQVIKVPFPALMLRGEKWMLGF